MKLARAVSFISIIAVLVFFIVALWHWQFPDADGDRKPLQLGRIDFSDIPAWTHDDHRAAFNAFRKSCPWVIDIARRHDTPQRRALARICKVAMAVDAAPAPAQAREFFETHFTPYRVYPEDDRHLVTGYFEPEIPGSLEPTEEFSIPVYAPPEDLVLLDKDTRGDLPEELTAGQKTEKGLKEYYTRREIEEGALKGRGLELVYLADPIAAYSMQLQGSARIRLRDGKTLRLGFAGKNGHAYTSLGQLVISRGILPPHKASLTRIFEWIKKSGDAGKALLWENKSYVFFRVLSEEEGAAGPLGALGAPLTAVRSLAVDPRYHLLGAPIWVDVPKLRDPDGKPFSRLMIAQDTGSAIRGAVRGDIFWGTGDQAGSAASRTKHDCGFVVLLPNAG